MSAETETITIEAETNEEGLPTTEAMPTGDATAPPPAIAPTTAPPAAITPSQMLMTAVEQGADLDKLEKLMELQERWEAGNAQKAFTAALAAFKANPPILVKDKNVNYTNSKGDITDYDHVSLAQCVEKIAPALAHHGLSHNWGVNQGEAGITVTCTLTHALGHREMVIENGF